MDIKSIVKDLEAEEAAILGRLVNVRGALANMKAMNGGAPQVDPQRVPPQRITKDTKVAKGSSEATLKGWIKRRENAGIRFTYERLDARDFVEQEIRRLGREASTKELFEAYRRAAGMRIPQGSYNRFYQRFYQRLHGKQGQLRFVQRTTGGMGGYDRQSFFSLRPVSQIQSQPQAGMELPHPILEINQY
jgi:hypothetical protein